MPPARTRAFRITWFRGAHTWAYIHDVLDTVVCRYIIYQEEICPETERRHIQGYVYFENAKTLVRVRRIFVGADIRVAHRSPKINKEYCTKLESRREGGRARERGDFPTPGARHDIVVAREDIEAGLSNKEMFIKYGLLWAQYSRVLKEYRADMIEPRDFWTVTTVLWGPTGIGKSYRTGWMAKRNPGSVGSLLIPRDGKDMVWGDGCVAANTVIIEDIGCPGEINLTMLKRMLDRHPCPMPVKGTHMQWAPHYVIITSNYDPQTWYPGEEWTPETNPLCRRLTTEGSEIIHMTQQWTPPMEEVDIVPE